MITLLINPAANRGRAALRAREIERVLALKNSVRRVETTGRGDERRLAREACEVGASALAVVGGDGAAHHAARGLLEAGAPIPMAIIAAGTGNDFVKSIGSPSHDIDAMATRIARGETRTIDVGVIDGVPFLNAAGFGLDVEILRRMEQSVRLPGIAPYVTTALRTLLNYGGFHAALRHDENPSAMDLSQDARGKQLDLRLMTVFANGTCFGGAFRIAPDASVEDGTLDVIDVGDVPWWQRPSLFLRAIRGTHVRSPIVQTTVGSKFMIRFDTPPTFEADGELYQASSTTLVVSLSMRALRIIT